VIYVDELVQHEPAKDPRARRVGERNGHRWCHMFSDDASGKGDLELITFAESIGMKRAWFQIHRLGNHFDLTPGRRAAAIAKGAKECTGREGVLIRRAARERFALAITKVEVA
jgi:hypothetical protein